MIMTIMIMKIMLLLLLLLLLLLIILLTLIIIIIIRRLPPADTPRRGRADPRQRPDRLPAEGAEVREVRLRLSSSWTCLCVFVC